METISSTHEGDGVQVRTGSWRDLLAATQALALARQLAVEPAVHGDEYL